MTSPSVVHPHGALRQLDHDLWCVEGFRKRSPLGRRMTIVRNAGTGELAVHSAMMLEHGAMQALDAIGPVRLVLVPNDFHASEASAYRERYPEAVVLVPRQVRAKLEAGQVPDLDGTHEDDWPESWADELVAHPLAGLRNGEVAFHHPRSRTLILTDIAFNVPRTARGALKWLMRINGTLGRFGPTRLLRMWFVRDRRAFCRVAPAAARSRRRAGRRVPR